jgi:hypothetical protein
VDLEEEADVKMILPCVGSKLREGSGLLTPEPSGRKGGLAGRVMSQRDLP